MNRIPPGGRTNETLEQYHLRAEADSIMRKAWLLVSGLIAVQQIFYWLVFLATRGRLEGFWAGLGHGLLAGISFHIMSFLLLFQSLRAHLGIAVGIEHRKRTQAFLLRLARVALHTAIVAIVLGTLVLVVFRSLHGLHAIAWHPSLTWIGMLVGLGLSLRFWEWSRERLRQEFRQRFPEAVEMFHIRMMMAQRVGRGGWSHQQ